MTYIHNPVILANISGTFYGFALYLPWVPGLGKGENLRHDHLCFKRK